MVWRYVGKDSWCRAKQHIRRGFYGVASYDKNKRSASVLCGGTDGEAIVKLDNISSTSVFKDADKVHIKVEASYFSGYHGAVYAPETVMEGVFLLTMEVLQ